MIAWTVVLAVLGVAAPESVEEADVPPEPSLEAALEDAPPQPEPAVADETPRSDDEVAEPPDPHEEHESPPPEEDAPEAGPWVLGGFIDAAYLASSNLPNNHIYRGMFSSPRTNELTLNLAGVYVERTPGKRDPFHLELALHLGPAADALLSGEPTPGGEDSQFAGVETWKHLARANAGLSLDTGTDITAGLMVCPIGLGVFWTLPNWHYTTPWTLNAVPYYLLGARVSQKVGDKVQLQGWVVNGWQTMGDINKVPSYVAAIVITPVDDVTIQELVYFGPDDLDIRPRAWRTFVNSQIGWNTERVGVAALFDIGRERLTMLPGEPVALWLAPAADVRWRVLGKRHTWDMAVRGGGYWDRDGRMFGVRRNWLIEGVYTNDVRLFDHVLLRVEYRYDHATAEGGFFYRGAATNAASPGLASDQHTVVAALTGYFELGLPRVKVAKR
jgi:hypothetical protein